MASEQAVQEVRRPVSPLWLRISVIAATAINVSLTALTIFYTQRQLTFYLEFYALLTTVAVMTSIPFVIAFRTGYWARVAIPAPVEVPAKVTKPELVIPEKLLPKVETRLPMLEQERVGGLKMILKLLSGLFAHRVSERVRIIGFAVSAVIGLLLTLTATFVSPGFATRPDYDNTMVLILIATLVPPSFLDFIDRRYRGAVDSKIPDFLRDVAEAQRTGMSFTRSLENATHSNYGALTRELREAMAKLSWGVPYDEVLNLFARSVNTALAHRVAVLLTEVGKSGGKMLEVLDMVYEHVREVITLQKERARQLSPYVMVIYASFGVYLFVVYILFSTFFAQISRLIETGAPFGVNINPQVYWIWFFHMSIIEAVIGGFVAGKIATGSSVAGLKHVLILLITSYTVFTFFIPI